MAENSSDKSCCWKRQTLWLLLGLSLVVTILNAIKPLHIDDTYYYYLARHLSEHPLNPFDVEILWEQWPQSNMDGSVPPLIPYYLAGAIRLFGERPLLWKLSLFPFIFIFVSSIYALLQLFAPRFKIILLFMAALSPAFLPSWNIMLDMPALALSLGAIVLFMRGCARGSLVWAIAAGIAGGLAMQTKFTGAVAPCVIVVYAVIFRHWRLGILAAAINAVTFISWELITIVLCGQSDFIWHFRNAFPDRWYKKELAYALLMALGGTNICTAVVALVGLKYKRVPVVLLMVLIPVGFVLIAFMPIQTAVFGGFGFIFVLCMLAVIVRLAFIRQDGKFCIKPLSQNREYLFLLIWLVLEIGAYFFLSPYGAVRRILGVVAITIILVGYAVSTLCTNRQETRLISAVVILSIVLGLGYYLVDLREAQVSKSGAIDAAKWIGEQSPDAGIWYVGHWGFAYYADQAGMKPIIPDNSLVRAGDWVIVPNQIRKQEIPYLNTPLQAKQILSYNDTVKLTTVSCFYYGSEPLEHREDNRLDVLIFHAASDYLPTTHWTPGHIAFWVRRYKPLRWVSSAIPYIIRNLQNPDVEVRILMAELLGEICPRAAEAVPALEQCLSDKNERVRKAAENALKLVQARNDSETTTERNVK